MTTADNVPVPSEGSQMKSNGKLTADEISEKASFMAGVYADIFQQLQASGLEPEQAQPGASTIFIQLGKYF